MTDRVYHRKLVRDKIPEVIEAAGNEYETRIMGDEEYKVELLKKLIEESKELSEASKDELPDELADVLQLIVSIGELNGISLKEIESLQEDKKAKRGDFSKKLFLEWSTKHK